MAFVVKTDLPLDDQIELDRINALAADLRTDAEAAFLAARLQYVTNYVYNRDVNENIVEAEGNTLPTGVAGFAKGALFRDLDKVGRNLYVNVGSSTSAQWQYVSAGELSSPSSSLSNSPSASLSGSASSSPSSSLSNSPSSSASSSLSDSPSTSISGSPSSSPSSSLSGSPSSSPSAS